MKTKITIDVDLDEGKNLGTKEKPFWMASIDHSEYGLFDVYYIMPKTDPLVEPYVIITDVVIAEDYEDSPFMFDKKFIESVEDAIDKEKFGDAE